MRSGFAFNIMIQPTAEAVRRFNVHKEWTERWTERSAQEHHHQQVYEVFSILVDRKRSGRFLVIAGGGK